MNKAEANKEGKKIYNDWAKKREEIEKRAKSDGSWNNYGLDTNRHLFKEVDKEAKNKLKKIKSMIDE